MDLNHVPGHRRQTFQRQPALPDRLFLDSVPMPKGHSQDCATSPAEWSWLKALCTMASRKWADRSVASALCAEAFKELRSNIAPNEQR